MLVMRDSDEAAMDRVLSVTTPAPATVEADKPVAQAATPAAPTANAPAEAAKDLAKKKATAPQLRERRERQAAGDVAEAPLSKIAAAPPPPPVAPMAAPLARASADEAASAKIGKAERDSASRRFNAQVSDAVTSVVATGAASGAAAEVSPALKQLRSDSTAAMHETTYEAWPGIQVVLRDIAPTASRRSAGVRADAASPAMAPRAALKATQVSSISWTDKRGHTMTLSGPATKEQLESIRRLLPEDKR
jgi:hypothetical protein